MLLKCTAMPRIFLHESTLCTCEKTGQDFETLCREAVFQNATSCYFRLGLAQQYAYYMKGRPTQRNGQNLTFSQPSDTEFLPDAWESLLVGKLHGWFMFE